MRRRKSEYRAKTEGTDGLALRPVVKVRLAKEDIFFGPGTARLLALVEKTGSIQEACTQMEISYSKGSRIIKNTEKELGFKLLERWTGGSGGGGSRLTSEGRRLLGGYEELTRKVQKSAEEIFGECFNESADVQDISE